MPDIDFGALLSGGVKSFSQARDYNLAVAQARQSASMRMRQMELQERESELNRLRIQQAMEETRIKTLAEKEDLKAKIREGKIKERGQQFINIMSKPVGRAEEGKPVSREKAADFYGIEDTEEKMERAREMAGLPTKTELRAREADVGYTEALTAESQRRMARPVGGVGTETERFIAKLLDPSTPADERRLIEQKFLGGKTRIDGVSLIDISRILNDLHPETFGLREGVPEGIDPNSIEFLRYGARLVKEAQGESIIPGDEEITVDSLFN